MKAITNILLATSIFAVSMTSNAMEVKTSARALTLCKMEAELAHPGYKNSTHKKIKNIRGKFKIDLLVKTETGKVRTLCEINKDGEIIYSKKS